MRLVVLRRLSIPAVLIVLVAVALLLRGWLGTHAQQPGVFKPPTARERASAIGLTATLDKRLRTALSVDAFDPIPQPGASDWLANHFETGQTFQQYLRARPHRPDQQRNKLYLQPLGEFDPESSPDLDQLQSFAGSFFQLDVQLLPPVKLDGLPIKSRTRRSGLKQLKTGDVLNWCKGRLPEDAYCLLAVTMEDLYPDERWNFVFGQATLSERVGVYSFARYKPGFYGGGGKQDPSLMLLRSCKVLAHETGHMFGIKHCIFFHCLMNGSNHLEESDAHPLHLCPVCLRKLQSATDFDVAKRYEQLQWFSEQAGFDNESTWLQGRLMALRAGD